MSNCRITSAEEKKNRYISGKEARSARGEDRITVVNRVSRNTVNKKGIFE